MHARSGPGLDAQTDARTLGYCHRRSRFKQARSPTSPEEMGLIQHCPSVLPHNSICFRKPNLPNTQADAQTTRTDKENIAAAAEAEEAKEVDVGEAGSSAGMRARAD